MPAHASAKQLRFFLRSIQMELITPYNVLIWATISTKGRIIATHDENRETILIVDDSAMNRMLLSDILADTYNIIEAEDGEQAIAILQQHASEISIVVLDMVMPKVDGFGVLEAMNENRWIQFLPWSPSRPRVPLNSSSAPTVLALPISSIDLSMSSLSSEG